MFDIILSSKKENEAVVDMKNEKCNFLNLLLLVNRCFVDELEKLTHE